MRKIISLMILIAFVFGLSGLSMAQPVTPLLKKAVKKAIIKEKIKEKAEKETLKKLRKLKLKAVPPAPRAKKPLPLKARRRRMTIGASYGVLAGKTGLVAQMKVPKGRNFNYVIGGSLLIDGTNGNAKTATIDLGGEFITRITRIAMLYTGGTINYPIRVPGTTTGKIGYSLYVGVDNPFLLDTGKIFGEVGYGSIATEAVENSGFNTLVGYKIAF